MRELISPLKKKKEAQAGNEWSNILPKSSQARKKPAPPRIHVYPQPASLGLPFLTKRDGRPVVFFGVWSEMVCGGINGGSFALSVDLADSKPLFPE